MGFPAYALNIKVQVDTNPEKNLSYENIAKRSPFLTNLIQDIGSIDEYRKNPQVIPLNSKQFNDAALEDIIKLLQLGGALDQVYPAGYWEMKAGAANQPVGRLQERELQIWKAALVRLLGIAPGKYDTKHLIEIIKTASNLEIDELATSASRLLVYNQIPYAPEELVHIITQPENVIKIIMQVLERERFDGFMHKIGSKITPQHREALYKIALQEFLGLGPNATAEQIYKAK